MLLHRRHSSSLSSLVLLSTGSLLFVQANNDNTTAATTTTNTTTTTTNNETTTTTNNETTIIDDIENLIECPLCGNDDPTYVPQQNFSVFRSSIDDIISCQTAFELGTLFLPAENCTFWQNRGSTVCGCASEPPPINNCTLCEDGSNLPEPLMAGSGSSSGRVCAQLQSDAIWDDPNNCITWQQTIGIYCGCNNTQVTSEEHNVCRICGGNNDNNKQYLEEFDPLLELFLITDDGSEISTSCGELEFDANLPGADCDRYQLLYRPECCVTSSQEQQDDNDNIDDLDSGGVHNSLYVFSTTNVLTMIITTVNILLLARN